MVEVSRARQEWGVQRVRAQTYTIDALIWKIRFGPGLNGVRYGCLKTQACSYPMILSLFKSEPIDPKAELSASDDGANQYFPLSVAHLS